MSLTKQQANIHLLQRAAFGPSLSQLSDLGQTSSQNLFHALLKAAEKQPSVYNVVDADLVSAVNDVMMNGRMGKRKQDAGERKMIREKNRDSIRQLNLSWLNDMINTKAQLREKMALFWHGHFACRSL